MKRMLLLAFLLSTRHVLPMDKRSQLVTVDHSRPETLEDVHFTLEGHAPELHTINLSEDRPLTHHGSESDYGYTTVLSENPHDCDDCLPNCCSCAGYFLEAIFSCCRK